MSLCSKINWGIEIIKRNEVDDIKKSETYKKTKAIVISIIGTSPIIILENEKFINNLFKDFSWLENLYIKDLYEDAIKYFSQDKIINKNKYIKEFMELAKKSFSEEAFKNPKRKKGYLFQLRGTAQKMFKIIDDDEANQKMFNFLLEIAKNNYLLKTKEKNERF